MLPLLRPPFVVAILAIVLLPATLVAQASSCTRTGRGDGGVLQVFSDAVWEDHCEVDGELVCLDYTESEDDRSKRARGYRITSASSADGLGRRGLGMLERVYLPSTLGGDEPGFGSRWEMDNALSRVGTAGVGTARPSDGDIVSATGISDTSEIGDLDVGGPGARVPDELKERFTNHWCVSASSGSFYLRAGLMRDWRYEPDFPGWGTPMGPFSCAGKKLFGGSCLSSTGVPVDDQFIGGSGFPVQHYFVPQSAWPRAQQAADRMYQELEVGGDAMAFAGYDFEIWGGSVRRRAIPDDRVPDGCDAGFLGLFGGDKCPNFKYSRTLKARVHHKTWRDPRVGHADPRVGTARDSSGGVTFEVDVTLEGGTLYREDWDAMKGIERAVQRLCGTKEGCSFTVGRSGVARGAMAFPGADDSLRAVQMCRAAAETDRQGIMGDTPFRAEECMNPENRYMADSLIEVTAAESASIANDRGDISLPTDEEKRTQRTGHRTATAADSAILPSQFEATCQRLFVEDSLRQVNGPIPVGAEGRDSTYTPTERIPEKCLRFRSDSPSASASLRTSTGASVLGGEPPEGCRTAIRRDRERWALTRPTRIDGAGGAYRPSDAVSPACRAWWERTR